METVITGAIIGAVVGLVMVFVVGMGESTRDRVIFRSPADVYGAAQAWAGHFGYQVISDGPVLRLQKGSGLATAATRVEIERRGEEYKLESWSPVGGPGKKRDMALANSSWIAKMPRKKALGEVNALLASLGQPPLPAR